MDWRVPGRILIALLLLVGVLGMGVHYAIELETQQPYPDSTDLKTSPAEYTGTRVFVFGTVEEMNREKNTGRLRIETDDGPFTAEVTRFHPQRPVQPGGIVQVFGTFRGAYRIDADTVRVVNPAGSSDSYKYVVSAVGAILVMVLFFRYWPSVFG
jgi:hypothetical protein